MTSIQDLLRESARLRGRAEGYRNAADSIEVSVAANSDIYAIRKDLRELVAEMRQQAKEDESDAG